MKKKAGVIVGIVIVLAGLLLVAAMKLAPVLGIYIVPPSPQSYAARALTYMEQGMYADTEEWERCRTETLEQLKTATSYEDTYSALEAAVKVAGGKHSFFTAPGTQSGGADEVILPETSIQEDVLVITLPAFMGSQEEGQRYAKTVLDALREQITMKGIILDLRGNTGGDMGPMVSAVSPLLPDGELLYFNIRGHQTPVTLTNGKVAGGGTAVEMEAFKLTGAEQMPIAILTDDQTASSAEATLLCFRGMENVKTFGTATAGYASCNSVCYLYDGAMLGITIGSDVARTGEVFCDEPILPDVKSNTPMEDAMAWIRER